MALSNLFGWTIKKKLLQSAERRAAPGTDRRNHLWPAEQRAAPGIVRTAREIISGGQTCPPEIYVEQSGSADFSPQQSSGGFFIRICERF